MILFKLNKNISDFVVVQSAWGMTQGLVMPLSGFLITAIGKKVVTCSYMCLYTCFYMCFFTWVFHDLTFFQASMISGSVIFSAGCALTYITINKVMSRWVLTGISFDSWTNIRIMTRQKLLPICPSPHSMSLYLLTY